MEISYDAIAFISKHIILRRPGIATLAELPKLLLFLLKQSLKTQEKLKELKILYQNAVYTCIF